MGTRARITLSTNRIQTVSVRTRHSDTCSKKDKGGDYRKCNCMKQLRFQKDGKEWFRSAATRSWEKAEDRATEVRDGWDPVKQKLKALEAHKAAEDDLRLVKIEVALTRWFATATKDMKDQHSRGKFETAVRKINAWAKHTNPQEGKAPLVYVFEITPDNLDSWVTGWKVDAERVQDRFGSSVAGSLLKKLKNWLQYCVKLGWIKANPAADMKAIPRHSAQTLPLLNGRYEQVIAATYAYDESMPPDDRFGPELRALFELMRWTGLRISDALLAKRDRLDGNRFTLIPHKTRKTKFKLVVIVPDHVVADLDNLPARPGVEPRYFFYSGRSKVKSLTGLWQKKIDRLNNFLALVDYQEDPQPLRFHSHQLRDTFAVEQLLHEVPMEDVSLMLGHKSVTVTEKYYAAWVPGRQTQLENKMIAALKRQGAHVTLSV
jgi:integrase/recombinase XerD